MRKLHWVYLHLCKLNCIPTLCQSTTIDLARVTKIVIQKSRSRYVAQKSVCLEVSLYDELSTFPVHCIEHWKCPACQLLTVPTEQCSPIISPATKSMVTETGEEYFRTSHGQSKPTRKTKSVDHSGTGTAAYLRLLLLHRCTSTTNSERTP
jgi:hypothetical protein